MEPTPTADCLLITDDDLAGVELLGCLRECGLGQGLDVCGPDLAGDPGPDQPQPLRIIHLVRNPSASGELVRALLARNRDAVIGVCLPLDRQPLRRRVLECGATEIIDLPLESAIGNNRLRLLLDLAEQGRQLQALSVEVNQRRISAWTEMLELEHELFHRLGSLAARNDAITHKHQQRTAQLAGRVALKLGLEPEAAATLERATYLHDIGKIGIPTSVLCKVGRFSSRDRAIMAQHPIIGHQLLSGSETPAMKLGATIALTHHERYNGSGYPHGRSAEEIPLPARIAAVADVYDSITEQRRYNRTVSSEAALMKMHDQVRVGELDAECVRALSAVVCGN